MTFKTKKQYIPSIWITWEDHRRSRELSAALDIPYKPIIVNNNRIIRYLLASTTTIYLLIKNRPRLVFCQNPSIILASLLSILKNILNYKLVVDRHSNFKLESLYSKRVFWQCFHFLSKWTVSRADLTIVTNTFLARLVRNMDGRSFVMEDKIPDLLLSSDYTKPSFMRSYCKNQIMFVTTFSADEPIEEMLTACQFISNCAFYFTGNYKRRYEENEAQGLEEHNIILTGFISEDEYVRLMINVDIVVILTGKEYILNCGAYEAVALEKPMILSNTRTIKSHFFTGAIYTDTSATNIAYSINTALNQIDVLKDNVALLKSELISSWNIKKQELINTIDTII